MIEGGRATGIEISRGGQVERLTAHAGVTLSAGAINTPHILMLSGVGDPDALRRHGISCIAENRQVGRNLMEHPGFYVMAELDRPTVNAYRRLDQGALAAMRWLAFGRGPMAVPSAQLIGFFRSRPDLVEADMQFLLFPYGTYMENGKRRFPRRNLITLLVNANYPKSRGHLELASADPTERIKIHPRYMDHPDDIDAMRRALAWVRDVVRTPPLKDSFVRFIDVPDESAGQDDEYIRAATRPFYHPAGTCRMGSDADAVCGPDLCVRGVDRLRVADTSIFPSHIGGNTNATAIMIGEKAASLIDEASEQRE